MAIPEELKTAVFAYCREVEDEETLPAMTVAWDAAVGYLEGAGVTRPAPESTRHGLWLGVVLPLTLDAYDQREAQTEGQNKLQDNPVLRRKLTQLKLTDVIYPRPPALFEGVGALPPRPRQPCGRLCRPGAGRGRDKPQGGGAAHQTMTQAGGMACRGA